MARKNWRIFSEFGSQMARKFRDIKEGVSAKDALQILGKQTAPVIFVALQSLVGINPIWSILFVSAIGLINLWGDYGQARINELVQYIDKHRKEFVGEILESDKFKAIFLNVLERHMKEVMAEKRALLRDYLLNVGKGVHREFDNHTKILFALDNISHEELHLLIWLKDHRIQRNLMLESKLTNFLYNGFQYSGGSFELALQALRNYGVVVLRDGSLANDYQITDFGCMFLEFIEAPG